MIKIKSKNLLFIVLILAISIFTFIPTVNAGDLEQSYSNRFYSINYPADWSKPDVKSDYYTNSLVKFSSDNSLGLEISVNHNITNMGIFPPIKYSNFDELISKNLEGLKENPELTINQKKIYIGGNSGYKITVEDKDQVNIIYTFEKSSSIFQLNFSSSKKEIQNNKDLIDTIYSSFRVLDFKSINTPEKEWNKYGLDNIEVYYPDHSVIEKNIKDWTEKRVKAFDYITNYLGVKWDYKPIKFFVFDNRIQGKLYGLTLGFALSDRNEIFTIHSQTAGHELTHIISEKMAGGHSIKSPLISEGLATYLNLSGRDYHRLSKDILEKKNYKTKIMGNDFRKNKDGYTLGASFVKYLIDEYGLDLFKDLYSQNKLNEQESFLKFYKKSGDELVHDWMNYLKEYQK